MTFSNDLGNAHFTPVTKSTAIICSVYNFEVAIIQFSHCRCLGRKIKAEGRLGKLRRRRGFPQSKGAEG